MAVAGAAGVVDMAASLLLKTTAAQLHQVCKTGRLHPLRRLTSAVQTAAARAGEAAEVAEVAEVAEAAPQGVAVYLRHYCHLVSPRPRTSSRKCRLHMRCCPHAHAMLWRPARSPPRCRLLPAAAAAVAALGAATSLPKSPYHARNSRRSRQRNPPPPLLQLPPPLPSRPLLPPPSPLKVLSRRVCTGLSLHCRQPPSPSSARSRSSARSQARGRSQIKSRSRPIDDRTRLVAAASAAAAVAVAVAADTAHALPAQAI